VKLDLPGAGVSNLNKLAEQTVLHRRYQNAIMRSYFSKFARGDFRDGTDQVQQKKNTSE
jgi:hypothetical protein